MITPKLRFPPLPSASLLLRLCGFVADAWDDIDLEAWQTDMEELTENFRANAKVATTAAKAAATQSWTQWADAAMEKGGSRMHKVCAIQLPWPPYAVLSSEGCITADPAEQLRSLAAELEPFWKTTCLNPCLASDARGTLGEISIDQAVAASKSFKGSTACPLDGFHTKHLSLISRNGVRAFIVLLYIVEMLGVLPSSLQVIVFAMLPKAVSFRLVALFLSFYKLWSRIRAPIAKTWLFHNDMRYIACGVGRSPELVVWRRAVLQEQCSSETDLQAATLL